MKVFELKNLINDQIHGNIESKDIQKFLEEKLGIKKTHSSNLEDHEVKAVKEHFIPSAKKTSETPAINNVRTASHNIEMGQELAGSQPKETQGKQTEPTTAARPAGQARGQGQIKNTQARPQGQTPRGQRPRGQRPRGQMSSQNANAQGHSAQSARPQGAANRSQNKLISSQADKIPSKTTGATGSAGTRAATKWQKIC